MGKVTLTVDVGTSQSSYGPIRREGWGATEHMENA